MRRDVVRQPLEQVMAVLWLVGMANLCGRLFEGQFSIGMVFTALLAGLLAFQLIVHYSLGALFYLPVLSGLAALLILLKMLGSGVPALLLSQTVYALTVWCLTVYAERRGAMKTVIGLLTIRPEGSRLDSARLQAVCHVTAVWLLSFAVIVQLGGSALMTGEGGHSINVLLTLLSAMIFFWFGGRESRPVIQSYLVIWLAVLAAMEGISLILHPFSLAKLDSEAQSGLLFVLLSAVMCVLAHRLANRSGVSSNRPIYGQSLRVSALALAALAAMLQWMQLIEYGALVVRLPDVLVPLAAASVLIGANFQLRLPGIDLMAFGLGLLGLLSFDYYVLHPGMAFDMRPAQGHPDQWLLLGATSLMLSLASTGLEAGRFAENYVAPLKTAAAVAYIWALLAAIIWFGGDPIAHGGFHLGMSLILVAGQFMLLRDLKYADRIRGVTVPLLLLAGIWALLAVAHVTGFFRYVLAVYAFGLLAASRCLLSFVNERWPKWAVDQASPEWIGLVLLYAALLDGGPIWVEEWPWLMTVVVYQFLFGKSWLNVPSFLMAALAVLWADSAWFHPGDAFSLWPKTQGFPDIWLILACMSLAYAVMSRLCLNVRAWSRIYSGPLQTAGALCWIWAFIGVVALLLESGFSESGIIPWILLTLLLALFPLSQSFPIGDLLRDIGSSLLFALLMLCLWEQSIQTPPLWGGLLILGFMLWGIASFIIPRFGRQFPAWDFKPFCWPWLGLLAVIAAFPDEPIHAFSLFVYFLSLSLYAALMLRYSRESWFVWLPGICFSLAGIAAGVQTTRLLWIFHQTSFSGPIGIVNGSRWLPLAFAVNMLAWANLQLLLVKAGRRKGRLLAEKLQLLRHDLSRAFENGARWIMTGWLSFYAVWIAIALRTSLSPSAVWATNDVLLVGLLLIASILHALYSRFSAFGLHSLLIALFLTILGGYAILFSDLLLPPFLFALWCLLLVALEAVCARYPGKNRPVIERVLAVWTRFSLLFATLTLLVYPFEVLGDVLSSLLLLSFITAFRGLWWLRARWFYVACAELLAVLHLWPFLWLDAGEALVLLPWFALQLYLLTRLMDALSSRLGTAVFEVDGRVAMCRLVLSFQPWLNVLAFIELMAHGAAVFYSLLKGVAVSWLFPLWDPAAALCAGLIQFGIGVRQARKTPDGRSVYGLVFFFAVLGFYVRLVFFGLAPVTLWDTSILILFAYGQFFIHRLFPSSPLLHMAMLTPLAALLTVPMQLQSAEASATLMLTGVLYLIMRRYTQKQLPLYLALLAFNIGIYLWIPGFVEQSHLIQVYVIPAALTLLVLVQLHRRELKPSVMMATRLAATSSIYACATLDVFLLPDLEVFVLALALSLAGIVVGIALRIRAFLYAGVAFILLNVFGQLIRFYPEEALGKAVVLMGTGMIILSAMIWFNLKKMQVLKKFNLIRGELETWE